MRLLNIWALFAVSSIGFAACGGSTEEPSQAAAGSAGAADGGMDSAAGNGGSGGNAGGNAGSAGTGGSAGAAGNAGSAGSGGTGFTWNDCKQDSSTCGAADCVEVTPGFSECAEPTPDPVMSCDGQGPPGEPCCKSSADCAATELCVSVMAGMGAWNECRADSCAADKDCPTNYFCAPRGVLGAIVRECRPAYCQSDADCKLSTDARCAPVTAGQVGDCADQGLYCVYPALGGCRNHSDCPAGSHCEADSTTREARCVGGAKEQCPAVP